VPLSNVPDSRRGRKEGEKGSSPRVRRARRGGKKRASGGRASRAGVLLPRSLEERGEKEERPLRDCPSRKKRESYAADYLAILEARGL